MKHRNTLILGAVLAASVGLAPAATVFNPESPSQRVSCRIVDEAIRKVPRGDGDGVVTDAEMGPGSWRFNGRGQSFLTYKFTLNESSTAYSAVLGKSNFFGNRGVVNDYPQVLDVWSRPSYGVMKFRSGRGELVLHGDTAADPPRFALPGNGAGTVRIPLRDPDGDGVFEGCASSPWLKNFGVLVPEGGDFLQHMLYKAYATTDANGVVTMFEWTETAVFKKVKK